MNNKILVLVYVPLIEKEFDIYIPLNKKIGTVKKLIIDIVKENSDGLFIDDGTKNLYDKLNGELINEQQFVKNSKIINGSKLVLY